MSSLLESAWVETASKLRGFIRSRVRDHSAAEDILQDVFLKAHTRINQLRAGEKVEGWLHLIARNAIADHYRKLRPTSEIPDDLQTPEAELQSSPEADGLRNAFKQMVWELPEPYREALVLTEFEGLSQQQLADRLGISLSGAKSRVQRGREKLKKNLLDCCALEFDRRGSVIDCQPRRDTCQCGD